METNAPKPSLREAFLRIIAVLGLVAVLLLGAWGIIQLAVALPNVFGSIGGSVASLFGATTAESVTVSVPQSTAPDQPLTLSWTHQNQTGQYAYSYTISYACQNGLSIKAPLPTGSYQTVACNTPFNFVNATEHMIVVPSISGSQSVPLTLSVSATNLSTGAITASGSATTQVTSGAAVTTTQPAANTGSPKTTPVQTAKPTTTTYYPAATRPALYGLPDLAVQIIGVTSNGAQAQVQFAIVNNGTNVAASGWTFNAQLPVSGGYTFVSQPQQALYPGDKIVYTLGFNNSGNYPSNQNPYTYNNGWGYTASGYTAGTYTCNIYGPCQVPGYQNLYPYGSPYQYGYNGYSYSTPGYSYNYGGGTVTITVDPYNLLPDLNRANNTANVLVH